MREVFHGQLDDLADDLVRLTLMVETAMGRATAALLEPDALLAQRVVGDQQAVLELRDEIDQRALELTARQQPVAGDLRVIVAALRMAGDLERMGVLARHVAQLAGQHVARPPVPEELREIVKRMGTVAEQITAATRRALAVRDWRSALELERSDDEMDRLLEALYRRMLHGSWPYGIETAMDVTLLGRYYERYADHAVAVARRVVYLAGRASLDDPEGAKPHAPITPVAGSTR